MKQNGMNWKHVTMNATAARLARLILPWAVVGFAFTGSTPAYALPPPGQVAQVAVANVCEPVPALLGGDEPGGSEGEPLQLDTFSAADCGDECKAGDPWNVDVEITSGGDDSSELYGWAKCDGQTAQDCTKVGAAGAENCFGGSGAGGFDCGGEFKNGPLGQKGKVHCADPYMPNLSIVVEIRG